MADEEYKFDNDLTSVSTNNDMTPINGSVSYGSDLAGGGGGTASIDLDGSFAWLNVSSPGSELKMNDGSAAYWKIEWYMHCDIGMNPGDYVFFGVDNAWQVVAETLGQVSFAWVDSGSAMTEQTTVFDYDAECFEDIIKKYEIEYIATTNEFNLYIDGTLDSNYDCDSSCSGGANGQIDYTFSGDFTFGGGPNHLSQGAPTSDTLSDAWFGTTHLIDQFSITLTPPASPSNWTNFSFDTNQRINEKDHDWADVNANGNYSASGFSNTFTQLGFYESDYLLDFECDGGDDTCTVYYEWYTDSGMTNLACNASQTIAGSSETFFFDSQTSCITSGGDRWIRGYAVNGTDRSNDDTLFVDEYLFECEDGIDNDADTDTDLADAGCQFTDFTSEDPECNDGIDNDADGQIDMADDGCAYASDRSETDHPTDVVAQYEFENSFEDELLLSNITKDYDNFFTSVSGERAAVLQAQWYTSDYMRATGSNLNLQINESIWKIETFIAMADGGGRDDDGNSQGLFSLQDVFGLEGDASADTSTFYIKNSTGQYQTFAGYNISYTQTTLANYTVEYDGTTLYFYKDGTEHNSYSVPGLSGFKHAGAELRLGQCDQISSCGTVPWSDGETDTRMGSFRVFNNPAPLIPPNILPTLTDVGFNDTAYKNYQDMAYSVTAFDDDLDSMNVTFQFENDTDVLKSETFSGVSNGTTLSSTLAASNYDEFHNITVTVQATDGTDTSNLVNNTIQISETFECEDGLDNDGDTFTDFPLDPGCTSGLEDDELGTTECDDGTDNDGDTFTDYPDDSGCDDASDDNEASTYNPSYESGDTAGVVIDNIVGIGAEIFQYVTIIALGLLIIWFAPRFRLQNQ